MRKELEDLEKNGFVLINGVVPKGKLDLVLKNTFSLLGRFVEVPAELKGSEAPWKNSIFHNIMQSLRSENPEAFGALYDSAQSSVVLDSIFTDGKVPEIVSDLLGIKVEELSSSGHIQRMDAPKDSRNLYGWHQEISYYPQNRNGAHGLAVWIPLLDVPLGSGELTVAKGSHKEGFIRVESKKENALGSKQNLIDDSILEKYEHIKMPVKAGDVLIMYMTTIHKSGSNDSDRFRFVAIGRYHTATAKDFTPYRYKYLNNKWTKKNLENEGFDVSDL